MINLSILCLLFSNAVTLRRDMSILFNRIAIIALKYCFFQEIVSLSFINKGIGLHGGLLHVTNITQIFHIFVFIVCMLILQLTSFFPRKVWVKEHSSIKDLLFNNFIFYRTKIINKMGEHLKIIEYPLILLFVVSGAIFLMSTNDLVSIFLSIELQSYGCAPGEAYTAEVIAQLIVGLILLGIFGLSFTERYLPRVITSSKTNKILDRIADCKGISQRGLPLLEVYSSGGGHGQNNKFDTHRAAQLGLYVLSRISRHMKGLLNVVISRPYNSNCQSPFTHFSIEDINAQSPKTAKSNASVLQPRDLTAKVSENDITRRRNFHSDTLKESSWKMPLNDAYDSDIKDTDELNPKGSKSSTSISSWANKEVDKYLKGNGTYNGLIRIITDPLFLQGCYNEIKSKPGNMTKGTDNSTLDGINKNWFENTSKDILKGKFKFLPARRVMIPKPGKKELRPLNVANPREKIIQKAITVTLEAIWEKTFSNNSYGFRPNTSLHQALYQIYRKGSNYPWVIQGDISKCFDMIPHKVIENIIGKKIICNKTMQLIRKSLTAGYIDQETGTHVIPKMGTPQGSVLSPLLANIVLNELDRYMEEFKVNFEKGNKRAKNKEYNSITSKIQNLQKFHPGSPEIKRLAVLRRKIPSTMFNDPNFKRIMYLRYADDFIILVAGSSNDAKMIKNRICDILDKRCGLELNKEKTVVTATKDGFKFLGAYCQKPTSIKAGLFTSKKGVNSGKYRMRMRVMIPMKDVIKKLASSKFVLYNKFGMPVAVARKDLVNFEHHEIITFYNHRILGITNFYGFASNLNSLRKIIMFLQLSCALTLALKLKLRTKKQAFNKFGPKLTDPETGITLKLPKDLKVKYNFLGAKSDRIDNILKVSWFNKLSKSNLNKKCVICESSKNIEMHHIRQVKDVKNLIKTGKSTYQQWVGTFYRKQVPLCAYHHDLYHSGDLNYADMTKIRKYT
jgi:group II intron reverse transcriptase/maturase